MYTWLEDGGSTLDYLEGMQNACTVKSVEPAPQLSSLEETVSPTSLNGWELVVLDVDKASALLGKYFTSVRMSPKIVRVKDFRSIDKNHLCDTVHCAFEKYEYPSADSAVLTLYGSGNYHHYTYALCKVLADTRSKEYGYIHFDHHHDSYNEHTRGDLLDCGSFVRALRTDTNCSAVLNIGTRGTHNRPGGYVGRQLSPWTLKNAPHAFLGELERLPQDVYLSFDLDVMHKSLLVTDWDHGRMQLDELMGYIETIKEHKTIIGADVLGFSSTKGFKKKRNRSAQLYHKIACALMDVAPTAFQRILARTTNIR